MGEINFTMTGLLDQGWGGEVMGYKYINYEVLGAESNNSCYFDSDKLSLFLLHTALSLGHRVESNDLTDSHL